MTPFLLSYPPINISHWFFRWIYLNSRDVVASSRSVPAPLPERPGELARRLTNLPHLTGQEPYFKFFQSVEKKIQNFTQIENVSKLDIYPAWPMYVLQNWTGNIIPHSLLLSVLKSVNFRSFADLYLRSLKSISFNFGAFFSGVDGFSLTGPYKKLKNRWKGPF